MEPKWIVEDRKRWIEWYCGEYFHKSNGIVVLTRDTKRKNWMANTNNRMATMGVE